jgi:hypothetical protein
MVKYGIKYYLCGHDSSQYFIWTANELVSLTKNINYTDVIYGAKLAGLYRQIQTEINEKDNSNLLDSYHQVLTGAVLEVYPSSYNDDNYSCVFFDASTTGVIATIDTDDDIVKKHVSSDTIHVAFKCWETVKL